MCCCIFSRLSSQLPERYDGTCKAKRITWIWSHIYRCSQKSWPTRLQQIEIQLTLTHDIHLYSLFAFVIRQCIVFVYVHMCNPTPGGFLFRLMNNTTLFLVKRRVWERMRNVTEDSKSFYSRSLLPWVITARNITYYYIILYII